MDVMKAEACWDLVLINIGCMTRTRRSSHENVEHS